MKNQSKQSNKVSLTVPGDARYLKVLRSVLESVGQIYDFEEKDIQSMQLAANEAFANIIEHSYCNQANCPIYITLSSSKDKLQLELEDEGIPLEPEKIKSRALEDVKPGGLGVHFMKSLMDEVIFDTSNKRNRLILIKERSKSNERFD